MVQGTDRHTGVFRSLDWWTVIIYLALLVLGWLSVCGASYTFEEPDIFSLETRSGMQIVWIAVSITVSFIIMLLDDRLFDTFAYIIYLILLIILFLTIFNPHEIKGSRSWLIIGPFSFQPAEFAKFATALALAKLMSTYGYDIHNWKHFGAALMLVFLPMLCIIGQQETGSALVFLAFFLMFYREGMPGGILFTAMVLVIYFVVGIKYEDVALWDTVSSTGKFSVLLLVQVSIAGLIYVYTENKKQAWTILGLSSGITVTGLLFSEFVIPSFDVVWLQLAISLLLILFLLSEGLRSRLKTYFYILAFAIGSIAFFYSADYVLNNVLEPHQQTRINVLLGLDEDIKGAGYNVHQSEIAIGSGGLTGKGFLNGTQTKLKFVPEQDTDFIFCTIGEEEGFIGSAGVLLLFLALIVRLIKLSERQPFKFGRIYGYCVLSIFLFHVFINVGMVLGLTPVIGIPLPFFSYGGSSLLEFSILLFIFLRIDAGRNSTRQ